MTPKLLCKLIEASEVNSFYASLCRQYHNKGSLSPKQMFYVHKLERQPINKYEDKNKEPENSVYKDKTIKLSRFIVHSLKDKGINDVFVVNQITKVHQETYKAILVDIKPIRSHIGICTRCGKSLTDEISKAINFGPTCAKIVGAKKVTKDNAKSTNEFLEAYFKNKEPVKSIWLPKRAITILDDVVK